MDTEGKKMRIVTEEKEKEKNGINKKTKKGIKKDLSNDRLFFKLFFDLLCLNTRPNRTRELLYAYRSFAERFYCLGFRADRAPPTLPTELWSLLQPAVSLYW